MSPDPGRNREDTLLLETEYELDVLMDYCLYHGRQGQDGRTVVERAAEKAQVAASGDVLLLLRAMRDARFSVFSVEEAEVGVGVRIRDLLRDERLFLVDISFSQTTAPGFMLAGNIIALPQLSMTTGAMLPASPAIARAVIEDPSAGLATATVEQMRRLSPHDQSELAARVIHACLAAGSSKNIKSVDLEPAGTARLQHRQRPKMARRRPRNVP